MTRDYRTETEITWDRIEREAAIAEAEYRKQNPSVEDAPPSSKDEVARRPVENEQSRNKPVDHVETLAACQVMLKRHLVSKDSFEDKGGLEFMQRGSRGIVTQNYSATNAFGARIDGTYYCEYDPASRSITALVTDGPLGREVLIAYQPQ